jgi:hypothetical protein
MCMCGTAGAVVACWASKPSVTCSTECLGDAALAFVVRWLQKQDPSNSSSPLPVFRLIVQELLFLNKSL